MLLHKAKIELEYDEDLIICDHYLYDKNPTLIIINGKEYVGDITVELDKDTYIVTFTRKHKF